MTTILVTGGAGFIGAHLCRYLLTHTDWTVVSLDRLDEAAALARVAPLLGQFGSRFKTHWHDLRAAINPVHLRAFGDFRYVAHLAASSHVDRSVRDPVSFVQDNVLGTAHLLEYIRHHQPHCEKALYFSTDEVFGPAPEGVVFDEAAPWNPENPYAASKAGGEALCPAYAAQYGMPVVVSHCSNAYGPGQYREKFIPICIDRVARGELIQIHSRQGQPASRLYIHVDDVSSAVVTILEKGGTIHDGQSGRYNIVAAEELSNLLVAEQVAKLMGKRLRYELVENPPSRPKPDMRYALSGRKLEELGWQAMVSFEAGLRATVQADSAAEPKR
jgi:dTDP-glucose 4,6-dehydratase